MSTPLMNIEDMSNAKTLNRDYDSEELFIVPRIPGQFSRGASSSPSARF